MQVLHWVALGFLVAVYGGSGLVELPLWRRHVAQYTAWGYPFYWALVTPLVKFTAGILLLLPQTRVLGILLCVLVGVGATGTVFLFRTRSMYLSVIIVLLLTLLSAASLLVAPNNALAVPVAALTSHAAPPAAIAPVQSSTDRGLETGRL